ncbi:MAG: hypothetical protein R6W85_10000 [Gillisia sp.]
MLKIDILASKEFDSTTLFGSTMNFFRLIFTPFSYFTSWLMEVNGRSPGLFFNYFLDLIQSWFALYLPLLKIIEHFKATL